VKGVLMSSIVLQSAKKQAKAIRERSIKVSDLIEAHFEQIDKFNPEINAVIWQDREAAKEVAWKMDKEVAMGQFRGPLHGVPVTVKESFDLTGAPTTWGDPQYKGNIAKSDSDAVARFRSAGAIVFGKTNVPLNLVEWQTFNEIYGTTNNPWDQTRTPGGSSGGSAAALSTGMSALEVGSDAGSSIRNPAHYCGVFGLKPTFKVVSSRGQSIEELHSESDISVAGPLARTAGDLKLAFKTIEGLRGIEATAFKNHLPTDNRTKLNQFRIGIKLNDPESPVDHDYLAKLDRFVQKLEKAGAKIIRDKIPELDNERHFMIYLKLVGASDSPHFTKKDIKALIDGVKALNNERVTRVCGTRFEGLSLLHRDWINLNAERNKHRLAFDAYFEDVDILLAPATGAPAFKHDQKGQRYRRFLTINGEKHPEMAQLFWSGYSGVVGLPSVVGPIGQVRGLPVGYQAIAGHGRDFTALAFAEAVERELVGFTPPPLCR
tara:strand:- start:1841 stop:3310 length:1470 start_codon:yes stop_codon:yes gene_type:complete